MFLEKDDYVNGAVMRTVAEASGMPKTELARWCDISERTFRRYYLSDTVPQDKAKTLISMVQELVSSTKIPNIMVDCSRVDGIVYYRSPSCLAHFVHNYGVILCQLAHLQARKVMKVDYAD